MAHENLIDPTAAVPVLPGDLKGTRAGLFHILRQQKNPQPLPQAANQSGKIKALREPPVRPNLDARWASVIAADDFRFV